jgi:DNA-binding IclR family transcriptional regulator
MSKNTDISAPAEKTIQVMEFLSSHPGEVALKDIADSCGIAKATLLRILGTLINCGYVRKNRDKTYSPCFRLEKAAAIPASYTPILEATVAELIEKLGESAEIITIDRDNLFWLHKAEAPGLAVKINARNGYRRTIYELDAPSRIYLKYLGRQKAVSQFDISRFYDVEYKSCTWAQACDIFEAENLDEVTYDKKGNLNGVRRYAVVVTDHDDKFEFMLSVAEAAIPRNSTQEHFEKVTEVLKQTKESLLEKLKEIR